MELSDSWGSSSTVTQSICHVRASELYPKRNLETDEGPSNLEPPSVPFAPLAGEYVEFLGRGANNTVLALSNYRFYLKVLNERSKHQKGFQDSNIPLGLIEIVEVKDLFYLIISCKDSRTCRCVFTTNDLCLEWHKRLSRVILPPKNVQDVFAFAFHAWAIEDQCNEEISSNLGHDGDDDYFMKEIERLNISVLNNDSKWRISKKNWDYKLCPTYPNRLLVPSCITDQILEAAAKFRSSKRVPVIVWRHKGNGAILARCSQPEVGWLGWRRSPEDEELLKAICESCQIKSKKPKKLVVIDARSYPSAVANRARGGGCEYPEYYPGIEIRFMNLANIHAVRKSFHLLRQLCASPPDLPNWHSLLENTRWLHNISGLLHAANTVAITIELEMQPVLVHCSDGWDRTPQIVALAELLLDPYYRTIEGFRVLCQREWLDFGHKFADRGQGDDPNERCPVFIQWLDCVHNIMIQYPCAFEYSKSYLVKLAQHTYSNLFGTFLCNSGAERKRTGIGTATYSVWKHLAASVEYRNHLYSSQQNEILWVSCNVRDIYLWRDLYVGPFTEGPQLTKAVELCNTTLGMEGVIDPLINNDQPTVINNDCQCLEILKPEDITPLDDDKSSDTNSSSLSSIIVEENGIVRHSIPTNCVLNSVDGLLPLVDDVQSRLQQLNLEHKTKEVALQNEIHVTRLVLLRQANHHCNGVDSTTMPDVNGLTLADKTDDDVSVCSSTGGETTMSWEPVEAVDAQPTLWVPDHAVTQCMSCDNKFWLGRRRHHCRNCGKIFCADCSRNLVPLPAEQLYEPVRVCESCFALGTSKTISGTSITCKQAVADDQKSVNITLQPAQSN